MPATLILGMLAASLVSGAAIAYVIGAGAILTFVATGNANSSDLNNSQATDLIVE